MKGSAEIHTGNKKFREGWDEIKKWCGHNFGSKCNCKKGPWGCKCQNLSHHILGDGCDVCQGKK